MKLPVLSFFCAILLLTGPASPKPDVTAPPNIILILADDLGPGDISAGNAAGKIPTPHIDRLAAEGLRFTDAHSTSAVCTPTRYSILTGRYNWRSPLKAGVLTGKSRALIPKDRTTVASLLRRRGYHTAFIGKWHLGWNWTLTDSTEFGGSGWQEADFANLDFAGPVTHNPNDLGFDYAYGHAGSLDMAPYVYVENGRITAPPNRTTQDTGKYTWWRPGPTGADFVHEEVTPRFFERAIDYVTRRAVTEQPFLLYLALPSPHTPILPTAEWQGRSGLNPYADFVVMIDAYVGRLTAALERAGIADETMLVFTSDNGCSPEADFPLLRSLGHDPSAGYRGHKADIYEGGHRVPLLIRYPDRIAAGTVSERPVCTADFLATCADLTGYDLQEHEGEDSHSWLPLFDPGTAADYGRTTLVHHSINGSFAIREGEWKLILCPGSGGWSFPRPGRDTVALDTLPAVQLYHLAVDPAEQHNLAPRYPQRVATLRQQLIREIRAGRSTPGTPQPNDPGLDGWPQLGWLEE